MNLAPLLNAPIAVQFHVATIFIEALAVAVVPFTRRGSPTHRLSGCTFVLGMVLAALSSFFILEINDGGFSTVHLISLGVLASLTFGIRAARRGNISSHRNWMVGTALGGMGVAGAMAFAEPFRRMHQVFFG